MNPAETARTFAARTGVELSGEPSPVSRGMTEAFRLETARGPLLLKIAPRERLDMLSAEAEGLELLASARTVAVPRVIDWAETPSCAYLAIDWIAFGPKTAAAERRLGAQLAQLHRSTHPSFGWHRDNYIGLTPQPNQASACWLDFWREQRLSFQLRLASKRGLPARLQSAARRVSDGLEAFFEGHRPEPSLLHGDLWGGNWGATSAGQPYVFDPAVYYGDREADLAMTRLFGGFGDAFYESYEAQWPLASGWERRVDLYNLYHLLNHYNLFGGSYLPQVAAALERLTS